MLEKDVGRYLITQRSKKASLPGLWEFPGGKVQPGETDEGALKREMKERLGLDVDVVEATMSTKHEYPSYDIDFVVFRCRLSTPDQVVSMHAVADARWVSLPELSNFPFPDADAKTVAHLLDLDV